VIRAVDLSDSNKAMLDSAARQASRLATVSTVEIEDSISMIPLALLRIEKQA
jgi:hypothetical protein